MLKDGHARQRAMSALNGRQPAVISEVLTGTANDPLPCGGRRSTRARTTKSDMLTGSRVTS